MLVWQNDAESGRGLRAVNGIGQSVHAVATLNPREFPIGRLLAPSLRLGAG
jgi:hypothetical protein